MKHIRLGTLDVGRVGSAPWHVRRQYRCRHYAESIAPSIGRSTWASPSSTPPEIYGPFANEELSASIKDRRDEVVLQRSSASFHTSGAAPGTSTAAQPTSVPRLRGPSGGSAPPHRPVLQHRVDRTPPSKTHVGALAELVPRARSATSVSPRPGPAQIRRAHASIPSRPCSRVLLVDTDPEPKVLPCCASSASGSSPTRASARFLHRRDPLTGPTSRTTMRVDSPFVGENFQPQSACR